MQERRGNMKKIQKIISCLCIMCMLICMSNTIAWAEETKSTKTKSVEAVQQMINELPSMHEINDTNKDAVVAQLEAIDDAKLPLSDEERMKIDFTKYDVAAFVLSDSLHLAKVVVRKTYPEAVGPTAAISFLNENGQMETMLQEGSGGVSTCSSVEPVPNGAATYAYIEAGHYTLNEEVEGEWNASLTVNGQPVEGMEVDFEAGKFYSVMLTNQYQKTVSVKIIWDDEENQDGKRPDEVTVTLLNGDIDVKSDIVKADDDWINSFTDLSKYDEDGREIGYSVATKEVDGYDEATITGDKDNGFVITYKLIPETIDVSGKITWDDANNQDGKRPNEVKVKLLANGDDAGNEVTVKADANWEYSFTDLPKYENGQQINYTVDGDSVSAYHLQTNNANYNITLTHIPETTEISGEITWDDSDNIAGKRPNTVNVELLANGDESESKSVTENDNWEYEFENLPKYKNGQEISYTVQGAAVDGYESAQSGKDITYTMPTRKNITVQITWDDANNQDGKRPEQVTISVNANNGEESQLIGRLVVVPDAEGNWTWSVKNLPVYDVLGSGYTYTYSVEPSNVDGYISEVNGYNITYTRSTEISGRIMWDDAENQDGKRPEQVAIKLVEDGGTIERAVGRSIGRNVTVTADADWKYSFKDLPKYRGGREIVYGVNATVEGYTLTTTGYDIKCTHTPETIDVTGTITWEDADDQDGKRPEKVKVELLANGESIGKTKTVTIKDNWSYRFKDLPKYKAGKEIEYTIKNEGLEGYTLIIDDNNNLTYSKIEEKTETPEDKNPESEDKKPISENKKPESEDKKPVSEDKTSTSNAPTTSGNGISSNPTQTNGASSNSVPTGDSNNLWLAGLLFIVALCGLGVSIKKRSNTDK